MTVRYYHLVCHKSIGDVTTLRWVGRQPGYRTLVIKKSSRKAL